MVRVIDMEPPFEPILTSIHFIFLFNDLVLKISNPKIFKDQNIPINHLIKKILCSNSFLIQ